MELTESIRSRAHRTFKSMVGMRRGDLAVALLPTGFKAMLLPDEELLGVYQNSATNAHANLVFTTRGVYIFEQGWICLEYAQIADYQVLGLHADGFNKQLANALLVKYRDGRIFRLSISRANVRILAGVERRFPDLWEMVRFFSRVLGRVRQEPI